MQVVVMYQSTFLQRIKDTKRKKYNHKVEEIAKYINSNERLRKMAVFSLGSLLYCQSVIANPIKVNAAGNKLLGIVQSLAYWTALIMCSTEIMKNIMQGDHKSVSKSILKYSLAYGSLYLLPWIFDLIKEIFS